MGVNIINRGGIVRIKRKVKKRSNWSARFAWLPKKAIIVAPAYPKDSKEEPIWIWLERYQRFFNYGAPVNYVDRKEK